MCFAALCQFSRSFAVGFNAAQISASINAAPTILIGQCYEGAECRGRFRVDLNGTEQLARLASRRAGRGGGGVKAMMLHITARAERQKCDAHELDQPQLFGARHGLRPVADLQLATDMVNVRLRCARTDDQFFRNLSI